MTRLAALAFAVLLVGSPVVGVAVAQGAAGDDPRVVMVTWRGCEEACRGFWDYLDGTGLAFERVVLDADSDAGALPRLVEEVRAFDADLLVTWGTSVTLGIVGAADDDPGTRVNDVPAIFMIVADPVGAGIVESYERSGRPLVTGTRNRVPEEIQLRLLLDYRPFTNLGMIYNDTELNAVLKAAEVREAAARLDIDVTERVIANDGEGRPMRSDIPVAIAELAAAGVEFLYVGSSSFIVDHTDLFTGAALEHGLPVATAYEAMVTDSQALISISSPYYSVGQLAGLQAERILVEGRTPGELEVVGLERFTVLINLDTAERLDLYPPLLLLRLAETVRTPD